MSSKKSRLDLLLAGITIALVGYFLVWLPGPGAGLQLIGLDIGEWVKFLPRVQAGQVAAGRDLFYLPPITLGLILVLLTIHWPNRRWQTWGMRGLAVLVSLLAFPAVEAIRFEGPESWLLRAQGIGLVGLAAALSPFLGRWLPAAWPWALIVLAGVVGGAVPLWAYGAMRPAIAEVLGVTPGIGIGVWFNLGGHLLAALAAGRIAIDFQTCEVSETSQV